MNPRDRKSMIKRVTFASMVLASLIPTAAFLVSGLWPAALITIVLGILWVLAYRGRRYGGATGPLICLVIAAAGAVAVTGGILWGLAGIITALAAWDLTRFSYRLDGGGSDIETRDLERQHLMRLLAICGLGLVVGWLASVFHFKLSMAAALGLGFLAVLGLSQLIRALARESD